MDHDQIPSGFVAALIRNEQAVNAYAMMTKEQKSAVLQTARAARTNAEMDRLPAQLARESAF